VRRVEEDLRQLRGERECADRQGRADERDRPGGHQQRSANVNRLVQGAEARHRPHETGVCAELPDPAEDHEEGEGFEEDPGAGGAEAPRHNHHEE
jgi:hypothetical protein